MVKTLTDFLEKTAWTMVPPKAYGTFHLTFFFVGLFLCILIAWKLKRTGEKGNKIVLASVGGFLMLSEVYKQLFYTFVIGNGEYQWWIFPFQLCSIPMYLALIAPFLKNKAVQNGMYNFLVYYNLLGGFVAFLEPSGLVHEYVTLTIHAFVWHMLLVFIGVYLIATGRSGVRRSDYIGATVTFLCLCLTAFFINVSLGDVSGHSINMFFVGPKNSSLVIIKDIAAKFGWYVGTLVYIPAVCVGAYAIFSVRKAIHKREKRLS